MQVYISAIVLTKNEEKNIKTCLESLKWCDEVIVVDDNSTDETVKIAEKLGAKIYIYSLDSFSNQRNFGISKAKGKWILFVDADERISEALAFEISNSVGLTDKAGSAYSGFRIKRLDTIWNKELKYGDSGTVKLLRLAKKGEGEWDGVVHEKWKVKGKIGILQNPIIHYPHQSLTEFLQDINFYTTLRAKEQYLRKVKTNILSIVLNPSAKFVLNYFFKRGFLDGISGLIHALLMSFHSFLVRGKLWAMWNKK